MATSQTVEFETILEDIEFKILSGTIRPRERLVERDLMEAYGISRGNVRKILKDLAFKHLITHSANKGAIVAEPTGKDVEDIFETRLLLENYAIEFVIPKLTDASMTKIESCEEQFEKSLKEENLRGLFYYNRMFHSAMFEVCGNSVIYQMIDQLRKRSHIWFNYFAGNSQHRMNTAKDHQLMIECMKKGDVAGLKELNIKHLSEGYQSYKDDLRRV
jgi:DNA-binding GntR family transcriptional regulator